MKPEEAELDRRAPLQCPSNHPLGSWPPPPGKRAGPGVGARGVVTPPEDMGKEPIGPLRAYQTSIAAVTKHPPVVNEIMVRCSGVYVPELCGVCESQDLIPMFQDKNPHQNMFTIK